MKRVLKIFMSGLTTLLPTAVTVLVVIWVFNFLDSLSAPILYAILGREIFGLGFLVTIGVVFGLGLFVQLYVGKKIVQFFEALVHRIPLANLIFKTAHELVNSVTTETKTAFTRTVLVKFPSNGLESFGFVTREKTFVDGEERCLVFVPTTPNPTSGFLVAVKSDELVDLDIRPDEAMKIVISLGMTVPNKFKEDYNV